MTVEPLTALASAAQSPCLPGGTRVLVACSGGLDSVALLRAMCELGLWSVEVATVDHGLRDGAADDAAFVANVAQQSGVPAHVLRVDARRDLALHGPEAAARRARYTALEECAALVGADCVATAHTADDQAETWVMRAATGSGSRGLGGIPIRRGIFARPWLSVRRDAIVAFARARSLEWREDPSNGDPRFLRNRIRADVTPAMTRAFGAGWIGVVGRSAAQSAADARALDVFVARWLVEHAEPTESGIRVCAAALADEPSEVRASVFRNALARVAPSRRVAVHVERLEMLLSDDPNRPRGIQLPERCRARRVDGWIAIERVRQLAAPAMSIIVNAPQRYRFDRWILELDLLAALPPEVERRDGCVSTCAAPFPWLVRPWRPRDRYRPVDAPGSRRVTRQWQERGIDASTRRRLPVVEVRDQIAWAAQCRVAHWARAKTGESVVRIRCIECEIDPTRTVDPAPRCAVNAADELD